MLKIDRDEYEYGRYVVVKHFETFLHNYRIGATLDILQWCLIYSCYYNSLISSVAEKLMMN